MMSVLGLPGERQEPARRLDDGGVIAPTVMASERMQAGGHRDIAAFGFDIDAWCNALDAAWDRKGCGLEPEMSAATSFGFTRFW
jgi:hypothetical protein